ncbi:hypothetical protein EAH72_19085 [Pseudomonas caspiana]|nr:hypothetical protein EAH72_19085 [Pseudomonas caspiana]
MGASLLAMASECSTSSLPDIPLSRAGSLLQVVCRSLILWPPRITVGAWLAREGARSVDTLLTDTLPSRAGSLPQALCQSPMR